MRVSTGGGAAGAGLTTTTWSWSAVAAPSTGTCLAVKPSAVISIITLVAATPASLKLPSAAVVVVGPPPPIATVAPATGLPSTSTTAPVMSRPLAVAAPFAGCAFWASAASGDSNNASAHVAAPNGCANHLVGMGPPEGKIAR
jgi:hypothetical protein